MSFYKIKSFNNFVMTQKKDFLTLIEKIRIKNKIMTKIKRLKIKVKKMMIEMIYKNKNNYKKQKI